MLKECGDEWKVPVKGLTYIGLTTNSQPSIHTVYFSPQRTNSCLHNSFYSLIQTLPSNKSALSSMRAVILNTAIRVQFTELPSFLCFAKQEYSRYVTQLDVFITSYQEKISFHWHLCSLLPSLRPINGYY